MDRQLRMGGYTSDGNHTALRNISHGFLILCEVTRVGLPLFYSIFNPFQAVINDLFS